MQQSIERQTGPFPLSNKLRQVLALGLIGCAVIMGPSPAIPAILEKNFADDELVETSLNEEIARSVTDPYQLPQMPSALSPSAHELYPNNQPIPPNYKIIGVDRLKEAGWTGNNVQIYVMDTGITPRIAAIYGIPKCYDAITNSEGSTAAGTCFDSFRINSGKEGHGSKVAGLIKGIAPEAEIIPVRMINGEGYSTRLWLKNAIRYILAHMQGQGPIIVNMSFASNEFRPEDFEPLNHNSDIIIVTAAGNKASNGAELPAILPYTTIDAGAVNIDCRASEEDNRVKIEIKRRVTSAIDSELDMMAPGGGNCIFIPTPDGEPLTDRENHPLRLTGTSAAAPHISGIIAGLVSGALEEGLSPTREQIRDFLIHILGAQLTPGQYSPESLLRTGYYSPEDILGTPNLATGYGLINLQRGAAEWLEFLRNNGRLGEISFEMLPGALLRSATDELFMAHIRLKSPTAYNSFPEVFRLGESITVEWRLGSAQADLTIEGHKDNFYWQQIEVAEQVEIPVLIDPAPERVTTPTPALPIR